MGKKGKQNSSRAVERGGTEEAKTVRSRLRWVVYTATKHQGDAQARLLLKTMSGSVALPQPGTVPVS